MKGMNRLSLVLAALFMVLVLNACSAQPDNFATAHAPAQDGEWREMHGLSSPTLFPARAGGQVAMSPPAPTSAPMMTWEESEVLLYADSADMGQVEQRPVRRIKIGHMSMESDDIDFAIVRFENYTAVFGGWVETRSTHSGLHSSADLTLRVPADRYDEFILIVSEIGRVRWFDDHIIDVSAEYFDSQTRLEINRAEEARLLEFIQSSSNLEDIILLEARLSDVRTNIELHENNIQRINRDVTYSTLHVTLMEVGQATIRPVALDLGTRMGDGFTGSITGVANFLANLAVFIAYISVPLVFAGLCVFVGLFVSRRRKKEKAV